MYCSKSIRSGLHPEKKSFKEVDIYTASGMEAVDSLQKTASKWAFNRENKKRKRKVVRYEPES